LFNLDECKIAKSLADDRLRLVPECRLVGSDLRTGIDSGRLTGKAEVIFGLALMA
jgi:hypothetical protein